MISIASVFVQFGMFCEKTIEVKAAISVLMLGSLIGAMLFGQLSDSFGRKRMLLVAHLGMFVFNFLASRVRTLNQFTAVQMVASIFSGGHSS